jgi:rSAM/selenodomain-associated transferase 2
VKLSVIIPTYNEQDNIENLLQCFVSSIQKNNFEIIVIDGGSTDETSKIVNRIKEVQFYVSPKKGRASQMNYGASKASGEIFYFVHADVVPVQSFYDDILAAIYHKIDFGCYRYKFDSPSKMLKFNAFMTRFNTVWAGGGDQTLFIKKEIFFRLNGFDENLLIMEDFDLVKRAKKRKYFFIILPFNVTVSARKYINNSWLKVQYANTLIVFAWKCGASQSWMVNKYNKILSNH